VKPASTEEVSSGLAQYEQNDAGEYVLTSLLGYRVGFVNSDIQGRIACVNTVDKTVCVVTDDDWEASRFDNLSKPFPAVDRIYLLPRAAK